MFNKVKITPQQLTSNIIILFCFILLVFLAQRPPTAFDSYWHLKMGQDLLENGLSPWVDHYSFTFQGKEITTVPVFFQVTLASLVSSFGELGGFHSLKIIYITALMVSLFFYFRKIQAPWFVVFLVLPFVVYFVNSRLLIRPEIFSNVLIVVCFILYLKTRTDFPTKNLLYICALLLFWVNYHSPIIGYIIIFGLFLDKAVDKIKNQDNKLSWKNWLSWGIVLLVIGAINPKGHHFLITNFALLVEDFSKYTKEYQQSYNLYSTDKMIYIFWIVSLYTAILSLVKKQYGFAFICLLLTYFSWSTIRLVTPAAIVNLCIIAYYLSQVSYEQLSKLTPVVKNGLLTIATLIALFAYYSIIAVVLNDMQKNKLSAQFVASRYPIQVADYLKNNGNGGNIFNRVSNGGYLIYKLSPRYKVYIDGRTNILYPIDFLEHWMDVYTKSDLLREEVKSKNIQYAIYENTHENLLLLSQAESFDLTFADSNFLLFSTPENTKFPLGSRLFVIPMCWKDDMIPGIEKEISTYNSQLSNKPYDLGQFYTFINGYITSANKQQYMKSVDTKSLSLDSTKRLAAYIALKNNVIDKSIAVFDSIAKKDDYDLLMMASLLIKKEDYRNAENILYYLHTTRNFSNYKNLPLDKLFVFMNLLGTIQSTGNLTQFNPDHHTALQDQVKIVSGKDKLSNFSLQLFSPLCNTFNQEIQVTHSPVAVP